MRIGLLRGEVNRSKPHNFMDLHFLEFPTGSGRFGYGPNDRSVAQAVGGERVGDFQMLPGTVLRCTFPDGLLYRGRRYDDVWVDLFQAVGRTSHPRTGYLLTREDGHVYTLEVIRWRVEADR